MEGAKTKWKKYLIIYFYIFAGLFLKQKYSAGKIQSAGKCQKTGKAADKAVSDALKHVYEIRRESAHALIEKNDFSEWSISNYTHPVREDLKYYEIRFL